MDRVKPEPDAVGDAELALKALRAAAAAVHQAEESGWRPRWTGTGGSRIRLRRTTVRRWGDGQRVARVR
jgi:hypothetical protein